MGASFSSEQLAGAQLSPYQAPAPALATSYAFKPDNALQLGFTATFQATDGVPGGSKTILSPSITVPLKTGGSSVVACGPTTISDLPIATSVTCPIANSLIGVGTANFAFSVTAGDFAGTSTYLIAFTTVAPTPTGNGSPYPKNCRPIKKKENGFGPPDYTFTGSVPATTTTTTVTTAAPTYP